MEFDKVINKRISCRSFLDEKIDRENISKILDSAKKAPVAKGKYQDYKLFIIESKKLKDLQSLTLKESNLDFTYGAPLVIVVAYKGEENEPMEQSVGAIIENMELCASNLGLDSVFVYTIKRYFLGSEAYKNALNLDGYIPEACLCIGKGKDFKYTDKKHNIDVEFIE